MEYKGVKQIIRSSLMIPSLDLNFAGTKELDSRITYTRSPYGTVVGPTGNIEYAPENILLRSEQFNTTWITSGTYVTANAITNPYGALTAYKLSEDTSGGYHDLYQTVSSPNQLICFSVYAKAAEYKKIKLSIDDLSIGAYIVVFNLENEGSIYLDTNQGAWGSLTCKITPVSNGWYRCEISGERVSGTSQKCSISLWSDRPNYENDYYGGDGISGVYIWGAQLERNSEARKYLQTSTSEVYGARFTHDPVTGASLGLIIEQARTNLILLSRAPGDAQSITVSAIPYTISFTGTGTIALSGTSTAGPLVGTGTGETNRVSLTFTPTAGTLVVTFSGNVTYAQLEAGSFKTSYIPTNGTAVTRSADVVQITGTNFSSWYNPTEGTVVASGIAATSSDSTFFTIDDNSLNNRIYLWHPTFSAAYGSVVTGGSSVASPLVSGVGSKYTSAFSYKVNDFHISSGGVIGEIDTSGAIPSVDRIRFGCDSAGAKVLNGSIARLRYYNKSIPNKLQILST